MIRDDMPSAKRLVVIVAEDDPALRHGLMFLLQAEGYDVDLFGSAESLLASPVEQADCLVVDDQLPDIPGLTALRTLRTRGVATPAVLLVESLRRGLRAEARRARIELVEKPFIGPQLLGAMRRSISRPRFR